jgi:Bax protein
MKTSFTSSHLSARHSRIVLTIVSLMVMVLYGIVMLQETHKIPTLGILLRSFSSPHKELEMPSTRSKELLSVSSSNELNNMFEALDYKIPQASHEQFVVPHFYLAKLPQDFNKPRGFTDQHDLFVRTLLPHILDANHEIMRERKYLQRLMIVIENGDPLNSEQQEWLSNLARKYKVGSTNIRMLFKRVDIIPPSLALAQAVEESGWGRSHAARNKNSTFGITLSTGVKRYENLLDSVRSYILNLNSHPAYADMRQIRHEMRQRNETLCSEKLMTGLHRYSELKNTYIRKIVAIIRRYDLKRFDSAQLQTL